MDPGGGGFHRNVVYNDDDVAREFQPAEERRSDLQPPPPPMPPPLQQWQPRPVTEILERVQITGTSGEPKIERARDRYGDFRGSDQPAVAPRLTVAPPPPPPAPAGRPEMGHLSGGFPRIHNFNGNNTFQPEYFQVQGGGYGNEGFQTHGGGVGNVVPAVYPYGRGATQSGGASGTTLFVGELHWWTTDAEIEVELCKYGQVKEVKYFDDRETGKSKGFCQVDFYDPIAAAACEERMNGHIFNGRPCVVAIASPNLVQKMGERQMNKNRQMAGAPEPPAPPHKGRRGGRPPVGNNFGRGGGGGTGSWGRGSGMGNPGPVHVTPPPGAMLCQGFNPMGYGTAMGGMAAGFRGFPAGAPGGAPFPGMMPPFPPIVAPHINPAFFGWASAPAGVSMWSDMGGRGGKGQSSYGEACHRKSRMAGRDRYGGGSERRHEMGSGQNWPDRKHRDERERDSGRQTEMMNWERDRERQRERKRDRVRGKEQKRGRSRSPEVEHSKRHRQSP